MTKPDRPQVQPARPRADDEAAGYMPSVPWRWIGLAATTLAVLGAAYWWNEQSKAQALRAGIVRLHQDALAEASTRYVEFRQDITDRILRAATSEPRGHADRQLKVAGLRGTPGLYLRIARRSARSAQDIAKAAAAAEPDVIATCMGLSPLSARGLYERGDFLLPSWLDEAKTTDSVLRLRVIDDELTRRVKRDLPSVLALFQARWFLLVLEHGPRDREPVDVFLWDLREADPLLDARVQSRGVLMSARARFDAMPSSAPRLDPGRAHRSGAHDCSIGSQIKELAGTPAAEVIGGGTTVP